MSSIEAQNNGTGRAAQWRKAMRKTEELTLPSGMVITVTRPNITAWARTGRLPQNLTTAMMKAARGGSQEAVMSALNDEQFSDMMKFLLMIVRETVISPRIVENADPDNPDEIAASEIDDADFDAIVAYALPDAVQMKGGGQVTKDEMVGFHPKSTLSGTGENSGKVRATSEQVAGD